VDLTKEAAEYFKSRFKWEKFWADTEECFSKGLSLYERKVSRDLPLKKLTPIRQAVQKLIDSGNPHPCVDVVSEIIERDWKVDDARKLAESYCDCAKRAVLAQSPPNQRIFLLIANALFDIEKLIKEGAGRPVNLPVPHYGDNVTRFLNHYLSKERIFVGREEELEKLLQVAHFKSKQFAYVAAPAGKGKSALLAQLWLRLDRSINPSLKTVFIPISTRFGTATKKTYFERLAHMLSDAYGIREPEAGTDVEALKHYAFGLLENPPNDKTYLVLIIDALDEATDWDPATDHPIPLTLNPRVRVIMSARTTPERPSAEDWLKALGIPKDKVKIVNLGNLEKEHIREALKQTPLPEIPDDEIEGVVEELYRLTEGGDPLLLDLYLEALNPENTQIPRLTPEALKEVEPGYKGYFDTWLKNLYEKLKKEGTPCELKDLATDFFTLLALAKGPMSKTELADLTEYWAKREERAYSPYKFMAVLEHGSRLLAGDDTALSLAHPQLSEFFITEFANHHRGFKTAIANWGLQRVKEAAENPSGEIYRYLLEYLSSHLTEAGKLNELSELVISRVWFKQSRALDSTLRLLAQDIERLLDAVMRRGERPELWVTDTFYLNKLRINANNLPPKIFTALAKLGRVAEAKAWIELISDNKKRGEALTALLKGLSELDLEPHADWLLDTARRTNEPETLVKVAQALVKTRPIEAEKATREALETALKIKDLNNKAEALAKAAQALTQTNPEMALEAAHEALEAAHKIEDPFFKALPFAKVAQALAQTRPEMAEKAANDALEAAREIKDPHLKSLALIRVAQALAQTSPEKALEVAREIEDSFHKAQALAKVIQTLARTNPEKALEVAREIEDSFHMAQALAEVAQAPAHTHPEMAEKAARDALQAAREIEDFHLKSLALIRVAQALAQTSPEKALETAREALEAAQEIKHHLFKALALAEVAQALAQTHPEMALEATREALEATKEIEHRYDKARALATVAQALAQTHSEMALEAAREALETAQEIEHRYDKARALATIAQALAQTNNPEMVLETARAALKVAQEIKHHFLKTLALAEVAQTLAQTHPEMALEAARKIEDPFHMPQVLAKVAQILAQTHPEMADKAARDAMEAAQEIEDPHLKSLALVKVAQALAQTYPEIALEAAREALASAREIEDLDDKALAIATVAQALTQTDSEMALEAAQEALEVAHEIEDPHLKVLALAEVAQALTQINPEIALEAAREALEAAQEIEHPLLKTQALAKVAQALAQTNPKMALEIAHKIEVPILKAQAFAEIAQALALKNPDLALKVAREIEMPKEGTQTFIAITKTLASTNPRKAHEALLEAARAARAATMTWDWLEIAFPALAALDENLVPPAYKRLERILELLEG